MTLTPFSREAVPIVAVACTTSLAFTASAGGVTVNVAVAARAGVTVPNTVGPSACAVQLCGSCSASRTPCSTWFPPEPRVTVTRAGWPAVTDDGALTLACRSPGVAGTANEPRSGRFASAEESPTYTR